MSLLTSASLHLTALHLGALHAHERLLVLLIAFGPFVVLIAVVLVVRRRDLAEEARTQDEHSPAYDARETS